MPKNLRFMTSFKVVNQALSEQQPKVEDFLEYSEVKKLYCSNEKQLIIEQHKDFQVNKKKLLVECLKQCMIKMVVPKRILFRINSSKLQFSS